MAYLYLRWGEYMHDAFDKDLRGKRGAAERMTIVSSSTRDGFAIAIICQSLAD